MLSRLFIPAIVLASFVVPAKAQGEALVTFKSLSLETAQELAQAALADCRKRGFQVAVAVVDRSGILQVTLRDRYAGPHTPETSRRKAWTAISFRTSTGELSKLTQAGKSQSGVRDVSGALMLGGGVPVEAAGSIVAGVGVSGAPGGDLDEACAQAGIEAIADKIAF
ncbi:MAG: heme-binding protein [Rhodospirillales bacterium]|nr:heme-binding protein [Alphaproteobacteria bacterium]MBL6948208.1 heme-binding protein [Rhodospirillales bacterium]